VSDDILLRSLLFVPGHNERLLLSASKLDADVLLLDLEDSVQPVENKDVARDLIVRLVNEGMFAGTSLFPRVNDRESGQLLKDLYSLCIHGIAGFMYPKSYTADDIIFIDKLLDTIEYDKGFPHGTFRLIPLIETTSAVLNAYAICAASRRTLAVAFGCEDFISDLQGIHDAEEYSISTPRALIAMAARANAIVPIDTVHINFNDLADLEKNLKISKTLGYAGMLVLHPKEIPLVHRYFSPTDDEVAAARNVLALTQQAVSSGKGVALINGSFIGPPITKAAVALLKRHDLILSRMKKTGRT
jgi:citrate lyase subunit beta/citryl-CoA lyase